MHVRCGWEGEGFPGEIQDFNFFAAESISAESKQHFIHVVEQQGVHVVSWQDTVGSVRDRYLRRWDCTCALKGYRWGWIDLYSGQVWHKVELAQRISIMYSKWTITSNKVKHAWRHSCKCIRQGRAPYVELNISRVIQVWAKNNEILLCC